MILPIILSSLILETSKRIVLFTIFSGEKLNFSSKSTVTLSLAICDSFSFSQSLGCFRSVFIFLLNLSLGCTDTCFRKTMSSLVALANLSLGCTGTYFTKTTSSSSLLFGIFIFGGILFWIAAFLFKFLYFFIILFACCCTTLFLLVVVL